MSKKSTNFYAILAFALFLMVVLVVKGIEWANQRIAIQETQVQATDIARGFGAGDQEVINTWAHGDYVDPWENQFVLVSNSHESGVAMASRGPDGEWGTEDDIESDVVAATRPKRNSFKPKEKGKLEVVKEKASGAWGKVKGFFTSDKK